MHDDLIGVRAHTLPMPNGAATVCRKAHDVGTVRREIRGALAELRSSGVDTSLTAFTYEAAPRQDPCDLR
jgi:hypothetical protein